MSESNRTRPGLEDDPAQIVRSNPQQLRLMRRWLLAGVALAVLTWLLFRYWGAHANPYALLHRLYGLAYLCGLGLLAAAGYALRYAQRVLATNQYPPPGGWVLGSTRVRRDQAARAIALQIRVCAAALAVLGIYALYLPHSITVSGRLDHPIEVAPPAISAATATSPSNAVPAGRSPVGSTSSSASPAQRKPTHAQSSQNKHDP